MCLSIWSIFTFYFGPEISLYPDSCEYGLYRVGYELPAGLRCDCVCEMFITDALELG